MKQSFGEISDKILGCRITKIYFHNTIHMGDIYRFVLQLDDGSELDIGGKAGLAVRLRPLHKNEEVLHAGNADIFVEGQIPICLKGTHKGVR